MPWTDYWHTLWPEVRAYLAEHVLSLLGDDHDVSAWLDRLAASELGMRLAVCMAIDVKAKAMNPKVFADLIAEAIAAPVDPCEAFADVVRGGHCVKSDLPAPALAPDRRYARILEIGDFTKFYAGPVYGLTLNPKDVALVRKMYFGEGASPSLGDITATWTGSRPVVWVADYSDIRAVRNRGGDDSASHVADAYGLNYEQGWSPSGLPELVTVIYPERHPSVAKQPCTLDANWYVFNFFVAIGDHHHGWGLTHLCSGGPEMQKERVHQPFEGLGSGFAIEREGEIVNLIQKKELLLKAAFERWVTA